MIIDEKERLYRAWKMFDFKNPKMRVRLRLKNGETIVGIPFALSDPEPEEMEKGDAMVFPGPTKNSFLRGYYECDVETVELIEVDE